jgi:hypothetical protein
VKAEPCLLPLQSALDHRLVAGATFSDSYRVPLSHGDASAVDIFFAVFGHHPVWLKTILLLRHRAGALFGLGAARTSDILNPTRSERYRVGECIGPWPIHFLAESEVIAGRDDKHLDFRVSVLKHATGEDAFATISTVCHAHNRFGRVYLRVVAPFHKWGVQRLLARALSAGRL